MRHLICWVIVLSSIATGQNWEIEQITPRGTSEQGNLALDSSGRPHVGFSQPVRYACRTDTGWLIEVVDDEPGRASSVGDICVDKDGQPHIGYYIQGWPEPDTVKYAYRDTGGGWQTEPVSCGSYNSLDLDRQGGPHMLFRRDTVIYYAYRRQDSWVILPLPVRWEPAGDYRNYSMALDSAGHPGVALIRKKKGTDSLWVMFFEHDGTNWHRYNVRSILGYQNFGCRVGYDPDADQFHIAFSASFYTWGRDSLWSVDTTFIGLFMTYTGFALHRGRPYFASGYPMCPICCFWRSDERWRGEWIGDSCGIGADPGIAVDSTGRPHIVFSGGVFLKYARRLFPIGMDETGSPDAQRLMLKATPNPARRMAQIGCPEGVTAVRVYDATGRLVKSLKPQKGMATLSVISAGVYLLKAETDRQTLTAKLVVR